MLKARRMVQQAVTVAVAVALGAGMAVIAEVGPAAAAGSSWNIVTVAGTGSNGYGGDGGPASAAGFTYPWGVVAVPSTGDIVVSDTNDGRVRVIAGTTGTRYGVSMAQGNIYSVMSGLGTPAGVAVDSAGDIFVADNTNNRVDEVTVGGAFSTVAGDGSATPGPDGTAATSSGVVPYGVAVDPGTGNILVADRAAGGLRVVAESTAPYLGANGGSGLTLGAIYTVTTTAGSQINDVAVDPNNGNVVYSAGNSVGDGDAVYLDAPSGGTFYNVAATTNTPIAVAGTPGTTNSGDVTSGTQTGAPATGATFANPNGLFVDSGSNLLIADQTDNAIRVVAAATGASSIYGVGATPVTEGDVYTLAGTGASGAITPYAAATSSKLNFVNGVGVTPGTGELLIADSLNYDLEQVGAPTSPTGSPLGLSTVSTGTGSVLASWQAVPPAEQGFQAISSYTLTWYPCVSVGNCSVTPDGSTVVSGTSTTVNNLTANQLYSFTIAATNVSGTGPASGPSYATPGLSAPGPVTSLAATTAPAQMTATWAAPASNGGSSITGYTATLSPCISSCTQNLNAATFTATFTGLSNGTSYSIAVAAQNAVGTGPASSVSGTPSDTPGAPTITSATPGDTQVTLSWSPGSSGGSPITDYKVVVNAGTPIDTASTATTYTVTGLTNGTSYAFQVEAVNANGTGALSGAVNATPATAPTAAPTGIGQSAGNQSATITWTDVPPADNGGSAITGYVVQAYQGASLIASTAVGTGVGTGTITGLINGTTYTLKVAAQNAVGTGPAATSSPVVPSAVPDAPTAPSAVANPNGSVTLSWAAPNDNGSTITGYQVTTSPGTVNSPYLTGSAATSYTIPAGANDLTLGQLYSFTVAAINAKGTGPDSPSSNSVTPATAPTAAPTGIGQSAGNQSATITWTDVPPADNGGSAITGYVVQAYQGASLIASTAVGTGVGTGTITGLINGTTYTLKVAAQNAVGTGPAATSSPVVPSAVPDAPTAPSAVANPNGSVTLSWAAPNDNGSTITGYQVTTSPGTVNSPYLTGSAATSYTIPAGANDLTLGQLYSFTVAAINAKGTGPDSPSSNSVTPATAPTAAPTGIGQSAGNQSATITWTDVPPADNGGSAITGYVVQAYQGASLIASTAVGTGVGTGTITGLINGTTYTLKVAAQNAVGTGPAATSSPVVPSAVPDAPTAPSAVANPNGSVTLSWAAPNDNGSTITGYQVTTSPGTVNSPYLTGSAATSYTIPAGANDLTLGQLYSFTVAAINAKGTGPDSPSSNSVTPATAPTAAPTGIGQSAGNQSATITWTDVPPADNGGSAITGYVVQAYQGASLIASTAVGTGVGTGTITGLINGTTYTLKVAAQNAVGTGPAATSSPVVPSAVPDAPTAPSAVANPNGSVTLSWAAPNDNGSTITGYQVTTSPGTVNSPYLTGSAATSYTIPAGANDLTLGQLYSFTVAAINAKGTGPDSPSSNSVTPATAPTAAPTGIGQSAGNQSATITWTDVPPADNGGSAITGYVVQAYQGASLIASTAVGTGVGTGTITGLINGTTYTLKVAAQNAVGTGPAATSSPVVPSAVPDAPTSVQATSLLDNSGDIALTWSAPNDNGSAVNDYEVIPTVVGGSTLPTIDTASTATSFTVSGGLLTPGTTYTFQVFAVNLVGPGPNSGPSNQATSGRCPTRPSSTA